MAKKKILFLCTGNSCRSQMAEGWARALKPDRFEAYSAGTEPHGVNPLAAKVMAEAGIDISVQKSKHLDELKGLQFDCVVTVCDQAAESCPVFSNASKKFHKSFEDPPHLARNSKSEEEALSHYRIVRNQIRDFIMTLPEAVIEKEE